MYMYVTVRLYGFRAWMCRMYHVFWYMGCQIPFLSIFSSVAVVLFGVVGETDMHSIIAFHNLLVGPVRRSNNQHLCYYSAMLR